MKTPKVFATESELLKALRECKWQEWFERGRQEEKNSNLEKIVYDAVGANTFRGFAHMRQRPSHVFRTWGVTAIKKGLQSLRDIRSQSGYTDWLYEFRDHFCRTWKREMGCPISFGPSFKLPNLLVKQLLLSQKISDREYARLVWYLELPLDTYTIQAVARCVDDFPDKEALGGVPASASMSFVKNHAMYEAFQKGIRRIAKKGDLPTIALDCWRAKFLARCRCRA